MSLHYDAFASDEARDHSGMFVKVHIFSCEVSVWLELSSTLLRFTCGLPVCLYIVSNGKLPELAFLTTVQRHVDVDTLCGCTKANVRM